MDTKTMWVVIALLALLWAGAALLARAEVAASPKQGGTFAAAEEARRRTMPAEPTATDTLEPTPTDTSEVTATATKERTSTATRRPTSTATPRVATVRVWLTGGPTALCPGYNLYYTFLLTNTSRTASLFNLVITDMVPLGTWYAPGGLGGTISGTFDANLNAVIWKTGVVSPGQMIQAKLTLHSYSSLRNGTHITNTFAYASTSLQRPGEATLICLVDIRQCPKTNTPTRIPTATPTAVLKPTETMTPPLGRWRWFLPLVHKRAVAWH